MDGINFLILSIQENEKRGYFVMELNIPICYFINIIFFYSKYFVANYLCDNGITIKEYKHVILFFFLLGTFTKFT